ncbi:MAG: tricarballylate utilization 4Fe-4S protein TcuB [Bacteroidetes bacterium]|nr:tricarballylate utilization 4Fe-4S protein TcuB [Bacteroidota bacterium]
MPSNEALKETERVMVICNACRYCEGFCAVFPAMERRRNFSYQDLIYLTNLCHNCRGCYYACQYAPPHKFAVNVPKTFQELRVDTYQSFAWPGFLAGMFQRNGLLVALITVLSVAIVLLLTLFQGTSVVFSTYTGKGAFYDVIPYLFMVVPASVICLFVLAALLVGFVRFWRDMGGKLNELLDLRVMVHATWDAFRLRYLKGGGHGCNYPDEQFSHARRWFHHLTFYGFLLCFASTTAAAIYDNVLHWDAPYPFWSWPVMLGSVGGFGLLIGTGGLLLLKRQSDPEPANRRLLGIDVAFLVLLFLTSLTGLLLLALRETSAMGTLLAVHLGVVLGLFLTIPYSKFVHAVYHYAALVRNTIEQAESEHHKNF